MFWIRADGNEKIGAGHMMRCLTIAEELAELQSREEICFVCADEASANMAADYGFGIHVLQTDYREMESELSAWDKLLTESTSKDSWVKPVILVDSYYATDSYLATLRTKAYVFLMDDLGEHSYPVDCIINYNASADIQKYHRLYRGKNTRLLIGSSYVPIRRQFYNTDYQVEDPVRTVLITAGGGDQDNIAGRILERLYDEELTFYLVTGRFNPNMDKLHGLEKECRNVHICHDVKDMAGLMRKCDVAVTAGGSTIYELCSLGIPFICFSCADNQMPLTGYIREKGIAGEAGAWHKDPEGTLKELTEQFGKLIRDRELRIRYSRQERVVIDCRGAVRLAEELDRCFSHSCEEMF